MICTLARCLPRDATQGDPFPPCPGAKRGAAQRQEWIFGVRGSKAKVTPCSSFQGTSDCPDPTLWNSPEKGGERTSSPTSGREHGGGGGPELPALALAQPLPQVGSVGSVASGGAEVLSAMRTLLCVSPHPVSSAPSLRQEQIHLSMPFPLSGPLAPAALRDPRTLCVHFASLLPGAPALGCWGVRGQWAQPAQAGPHPLSPPGSQGAMPSGNHQNVD